MKSFTTSEVIASFNALIFSLSLLSSLATKDIANTWSSSGSNNKPSTIGFKSSAWIYVG